MFTHDTNSIAPRGARLIAVAACLAAAGLAQAQTTTAVTVPYIDRFEFVAGDGSLGPAGTIPNNWGGHQSRITRHLDSVRLIYTRTDAAGNITWQLMKRGTNGGWSKEFSGPTTDDVSLLRDQRGNDRAYVVAWPAGVPTVYTSPLYAPVAIPGTWQVLPSKYRQYTNTGISADGYLCLKVNRELPTTSAMQTSNVRMEYQCGRTDATRTAISWGWAGQVTHVVGLRFNYDYIFPNPQGRVEGLHGVATKDVYYTVSDVPKLDASKFPYVYNGANSYVTALRADNYKAQTAVSPVPVPTGATAAPVAKLMDSFIDSSGRMFSSYHKEDPRDASVYGTYVVVQDAQGKVLFDKKWPATLETYANVRMFEDAKNRIWLLWSNRGNRASQLRLFPVIESGTAAAPSFTLGAWTEVGGPTYPYALDGNIYISTVRGGTSKSQYVEMLFNACTETYTAGIAYNGNNCYHADRSGLMQIYYARLRLPD
ncbi:hypothetical protein GTP23_20250 [Pseudoduganella sp. FT93W]|uniref:Uncharacterized protein n=1 Tax=Duganella fentianensis TaxID=2692177 RepID=A0A845I2B7_9BURK|nr:hypothetical protein [Duganella fentianensis]MYN47379.1 hypothetical protein [Duganella fentianensis]